MDIVVFDILTYFFRSGSITHMGKHLRPHVAVFDTSLRDGEQAPGFSMSPGDKVRLAGHLERLGVDVIEAGFPIASSADFDGVAAVARAVRGPAVAAVHIEKYVYFRAVYVYFRAV